MSSYYYCAVFTALAFCIVTINVGMQSSGSTPNANAGKKIWRYVEPMTYIGAAAGSTHFYFTGNRKALGLFVASCSVQQMRHFANTPLIKDARAALAAQPRISQAEIQTLLTYAHF